MSTHGTGSHDDQNLSSFGKDSNQDRDKNNVNESGKSSKIGKINKESI